ncbi:hypothetical protein [Rubrolithibacter danxiaensis]|uniref:hypothetical protein n=1 Tax=Rubrolithibacter danxiaensis TaxID=3390805 RepID=UPI003BF923F5
MRTYNKKSKRQASTTPLVTAKKHWIVYVLPLLFTFSGFVFLSQGSIFAKVTGLVIIFFSLRYILRKASVKLHLTHDHLFIETGVLPWFKKYYEIPLFDVYKTSASINRIGRFLNNGTVSARNREDHTDIVSHINIANPQDFANQVNMLVQKLPVHDLNKLYELKERGAISEHEYNIMKLGFITHKYLA